MSDRDKALCQQEWWILEGFLVWIVFFFLCVCVWGSKIINHYFSRIKFWLNFFFYKFSFLWEKHFDEKFLASTSVILTKSRVRVQWVRHENSSRDEPSTIIFPIIFSGRVQKWIWLWINPTSRKYISGSSFNRKEGNSSTSLKLFLWYTSFFCVFLWGTKVVVKLPSSVLYVLSQLVTELSSTETA